MPRKQNKTKWSRNRQPSGKRIQNNDSNDDPGSQEKNAEEARNVYQRHRRTKKNKQRWTIHYNESIANNLGRRTDKWPERQNGGRQILRFQFYEVPRVVKFIETLSRMVFVKGKEGEELLTDVYESKSLQSCPTLCNPMDCNPPGYSAYQISGGRWKSSGDGWWWLFHNKVNIINTTEEDI